MKNLYLTIYSVLTIVILQAQPLNTPKQNNVRFPNDPPGSTCENPYMIGFPLEDFEGDTGPMGDNYSIEMISPNSNYINGNDMVFSFTIEETVLLFGDMTASDAYIGVFVMQDCPDPDNPVLLTGWSTSYVNTLTIPSENPNQPQEIMLLPGDYFLIVSSYPPPQTITFTLNLWTEPLQSDCPEPILPYAENITFESAGLGWTETGDADTWDIIYGDPGFDIQTQGTLIEDITSVPFMLDGLSPATPYEFYVRAACSDTTESVWSQSEIFTTECDFAYTDYLFDSFEDEAAPPECWAMWYASPDPEDGNLMTHSTDYAHSGDRSFRFASGEPGPPYNQFLRTPRLEFETSYRASFWYRKSDNPYVPPFTVGTSEDGASWNWGDTISNASDLQWQEVVMDIEPSVHYVAIQYLGIYGVFHYLYIDDFVVLKTYAVEFSVVENGGATNGSLTAEVEGESISSGDPVTEGSAIGFTATADNGYRVSEWTLNGEVIMDNGNPFTGAVYTHTGLSNNIVVTVEFEAIQTHQLELEASPEAGGNVYGAGIYPEGDTISISAEAGQNYAFVNWTDETGGIVSEVADFEYIMPETNITLTANFELLQDLPEKPQAGLQVYPNPASRQISIKNELPVSGIAIFDLSGSLLKRISNTGNHAVIDVSNLNPGMYILKIVTLEHIFTTRMVIE